MDTSVRDWLRRTALLTYDQNAIQKGPSLNAGDVHPSVTEVQKYLIRYGYLTDMSVLAGTGQLDAVTVRALEMFQRYFNLENTGLLDAATRELMATTPRCGMPEQVGPAAFVVGKCFWKCRNLTYAFGTLSAQLDNKTVRNAVRRAFDTWAAAGVGLKFQEVPQNQHPDFFIEWRPAADPDHSMKGASVAHADAPPGCSVFVDKRPLPLHFDDEEPKWVDGTAERAHDVESVALHEIGHLLGLKHSTATRAVMYAGMETNKTKRSLYEDDLEGLFKLYPRDFAPLAASGPHGYFGGTVRVDYRGQDGHVEEIYIDGTDWGHFDLSAATGAPPAKGDTPSSTGGWWEPGATPMGYVAGTTRVLYRGQDDHIHEISIYPETGSWGHFDMSAATGAPPAKSDPAGYEAGVARVLYRGQDAHIHEIAIYPETGSWGHFDMSAATGAPPAKRDTPIAPGGAWEPGARPMGYVAGTARVVYLGQDNHIHEISIYPETGSWGHFDMSAATGAPPAKSDPVGYEAGVARVVYRGQDAHIHEIAIYPETGSWGHFDMSAATDAPPAKADTPSTSGRAPERGARPMGYVAGTARVIYRGQDDHIHEIAIYPETGSWGHFDMSAATGAPPAKSDPIGESGTARVVYRGQDDHIHQIAIDPESGQWRHCDLTVAVRFSVG